MESRNKILVVDDSKSMVRLIKDALKGDYHVRTASSGEKALSMIDEYMPDLILLDVRMGGMDGYQVCRAIKANKNYPYIKILMVSGELELTSRLHGFEAGADDYITKPIELMELKAKVKVFLRMKALEDQLQKMNDHLNEQVEIRSNQLIEAAKMSALGQYAAGIVHNLNTPLQLLMGHAELFRMEYPDNPYIKSQLRAAQSMKEMIATILTNYGMASLSSKVEIDFNQMLKDLVEIMKADQFFKHHVEKKLDLNPLPMFMGTYAHFDQVLGNLLKNAIESMHESENRVLKISTSSDQKSIQLSIADSGKGIRKEDLGKIFHPFYTTKPLVSENGGPSGTGLGLASTKEMVESYNGEITVESEYGKGSIFKIYLPLNN